MLAEAIRASATSGFVRHRRGACSFASEGPPATHANWGPNARAEWGSCNRYRERAFATRRAKVGDFYNQKSAGLDRLQTAGAAHANSLRRIGLIIWR